MLVAVRCFSDYSVLYIRLIEALFNRTRLDQQSDVIPVRGLTWGNMSRDLENMKAQFVAVNGIRKVSCVVSTLLQHVF